MLSSMRIPFAAVLLSLIASSAWAQAFADAERALSKYSVADSMPAKTCDSLSSYKGEGILSIAARTVAATADTPALKPVNVSGSSPVKSPMQPTAS